MQRTRAHYTRVPDWSKPQHTTVPELAKQIKSLGWKRALVIDGSSVNDTFAKAVQNIEGLDVLPSMGANVYDILRRDTLVITKAGVEALEARLR